MGAWERSGPEAYFLSPRPRERKLPPPPSQGSDPRPPGLQMLGFRGGRVPRPGGASVPSHPAAQAALRPLLQAGVLKRLQPGPPGSCRR